MTAAGGTTALRDVLTFGETMLRLSPPGGQRLAQAATLEAWAAGSESNVAAALAALGLAATWVSRLPGHALGHRIADALRARGVDVSHVVWTPPDERLGVFYAEAAAAPRAGAVLYDRAGSAAASLCPADVPDALLDAHRHLHVSGITPALSPSCAETVEDAIRRARARGRTVSLDVNYRARLWPPARAADVLAPLLGAADVLICARGDAARLFRLSGDDLEDAARGLRDRFGVPVAAVTAGADGAAGCDGAGAVSAPAVPVASTVERLGSGDAFAAGLLAGWLGGESLASALALGAAAAALKRTIPGDMLLATRAEVESLRARDDGAAGWR